MGLIVFVPKMGEASRRLQEMVGRLVWPDSIEIFKTLERLFFRLLRPTGEDDIVLLLTESRGDLRALITNSRLLACLRIILILPDGHEKTIAMGHLLRPRFIGYRDHSFSDLFQVLQRMRKTAHSQPQLEQSEVLLNRGGV